MSWIINFFMKNNDNIIYIVGFLMDFSQLRSILAYYNLRRLAAIVLVASTTIIWTFNNFTLRSFRLDSYLQPQHVDDRIRVINNELLKMKKRLEDPKHAKTLGEYSHGSRKFKLVLGYTGFFHEKPWGWMNGTKRFNHWEGTSCPYFHCELVFDNGLFRSADAVLFHAKDMPGRVEMYRIYKQKPKKQKWIYFALEPPTFNPDSKWLNNLFHWTLTYRRDSDFYSPYGYYYRPTRIKDADGSISKILRKKDHFVMWASSHCGLPREKFIKKLMSYITVDVYGRCASFVGVNNPGECKLDAPECNELRKRYKFQLSFENSNCKDYITEKYWNALQLGIVPVVLGGANYSNPELAIPGSYINALDFSTVQKLAEYLKYLDNNDKEYRKYFAWRKLYKRVVYAPWTCTLCAALNMNTKNTYISRLSDFWSVDKQCGVTDKAMNRIIEAG